MVPSGESYFIKGCSGTKRAIQAAPPGSQAPAPKWQQETNHSTPKSGFNLTLHPGPKQFRHPCNPRQKGRGACLPPPRGLQPRQNPGFPLLQAVQTAPKIAGKGQSQGTAREHSKTRLLKSKNGVPPTIPSWQAKIPQQRHKNRETTKKHRSFFFFLCYAQNHDFARDKTGL